MQHNAHVIRYREILLELAYIQKKWFSQLIHYTELQKEINPSWQPEHMQTPQATG